MKKSLMFFLILFATISFAQNKSEKIKELIAYSGSHNITEDAINQFINQLKKKYPEVPESEWSKISKKIDTKELFNQNIEIYSKYFSDKEIDELIKFYKTDLGKKLIQVSPKIMQEIRDSSVKWAENVNRLVNNSLTEDGYLKSPPIPSNDGSPPTSNE